MSLPGYTAKGSLYDATAHYIRYGISSEATEPLVRLAAILASAKRRPDERRSHRATQP
jgi:hypothetical protein